MTESKRSRTVAGKADLPASTGKRGRYAIHPEEAASRVAEEPAAAFGKAKRVISATEAARTFSDLLNRVCYNRETYVVERGGKAMCELSPIEEARFTGADFLRLLSTLAKPAAEFLDIVETASRHQAVIEASPWEK